MRPQENFCEKRNSSLTEWRNPELGEVREALATLPEEAALKRASISGFCAGSFKKPFAFGRPDRQQTTNPLTTGARCWFGSTGECGSVK